MDLIRSWKAICLYRLAFKYIYSSYDNQMVQRMKAIATINYCCKGQFPRRIYWLKLSKTGLFHVCICVPAWVHIYHVCPGKTEEGIRVPGATSGSEPPDRDAGNQTQIFCNNSQRS